MESNLTMASELKSETEGALVKGRNVQSSEVQEVNTKGSCCTETVPGVTPGVSAQCCAEEMTEKECHASDHPSPFAKDSKMCFKHDLNLQADLIKE